MKILHQSPRFLFFTGKSGVGTTSIACARSAAGRCRQARATFRTPMMQLQDSARTKVLLVTRAETTPVLEAAGLQADLRRGHRALGLDHQQLHRCGEKSTAALLRQRANNERREIDVVRNQHADRYALIPLLPDEPVGVERLLQLSGHSIAQVEPA